MSTRGFADLMASRDTVAINIVFMIQEVLGVEVITEKQMVEACKNYITYLFSKHYWVVIVFGHLTLNDDQFLER